MVFLMNWRCRESTQIRRALSVDSGTCIKNTENSAHITPGLRLRNRPVHRWSMGFRNWSGRINTPSVISDIGCGWWPLRATMTAEKHEYGSAMRPDATSPDRPVVNVHQRTDKDDQTYLLRLHPLWFAPAFDFFEPEDEKWQTRY